jgi:hypothetical protein
VKGGIAMKEKKENKVRIKTEKVVKQTQIKTEKIGGKPEKSVKKRTIANQKYLRKFSARSKGNYEEMIQSDYQRAIERAHQLSSIDHRDYDTPVIITVPDSFHHSDKVNYRLFKKEDGSNTLLYDQALITALFFGSDSLYYYQANIDHRSGHIAFDMTGEFNYFDVVHLKTALKYDNAINPKYITLDIEVGLVNGTVIPFHLRNHRIHDDYHLPSLLTETEQNILDVLKKKVRESRQV